MTGYRITNRIGTFKKLSEPSTCRIKDVVVKLFQLHLCSKMLCVLCRSVHCFHGHMHDSVKYCDVIKHQSRACVKTHRKFIIGPKLEN